MKTYILIFLSLVLLTSQQVFAHGDHAHDPITEAQAVTLAASVTKQLSDKDVGISIGKLQKSWASVSEENIAMYKKGRGYYIVSVANDDDVNTLYVLMSSEGEVYDANFSGEFKGTE